MGHQARQLNKTFWLGLVLVLVLLQQLGLTSEAKVIVPPETIEQRVKQHILESTKLEEKDAELCVDIVRSPGENIVLEGETLEIILTDNRITDIPWRTIVNVTLTTEAESRHLGVPVHVSVEKPVWVTKRLIPAKSKIEKKDLTVQRKRLTHEAGYVLAATDDVSQYTALLNILPGQMLDARKVRKIPAVYRNDDVRITLTLPGGVKVSVYGLAMEDGAIGDRIRVKHQQAGRLKPKIYTGQVTGKNQVLVTM